MGILIFVAVLAAWLTPVILIGKWILGPIDRAAKFRQAPVRFSVGDFLCLFLAIQIPLAGAYQFAGTQEQDAFWMFTILTWVMAPLIWFACTRAISKAGVTKSSHRLIFLGLIVPFAYYGLIPFSIIPGVWLVIFWTAS